MPRKKTRRKNAWGTFQKKHAGKGYTKQQMKDMYRRTKRSKFGSTHPLTALEKDVILKNLQHLNGTKAQRRHRYGASRFGLAPLFSIMGPPLTMRTPTPWCLDD